ncbi:hypothetical protein T484DRAFT_1584748, partial [Baffinella frigidus]
TGRDCSACSTGTAKGTGDGVCSGCASGKFASSTGKTSCDSHRSTCSNNGAGWVTNSAGTATSDLTCHCSAGYGGSTCAECGINTFKKTTGNGECTRCTTNSLAFVQGTGQTADTCICNSGYRKNGDSCAACGLGTYKIQASNDNTCSECTSQSTTLNNAQTSNTCVCLEGYTPGSETNLANGGTCDACATGKYKSTTGSVVCTDCAADSYSTTEAATTTDTCLPCDVNAQAPAGSSAISACICNAGYVIHDSSRCDPCPSNYFSNAGTECEVCP